MHETYHFPAAAKGLNLLLLGELMSMVTLVMANFSLLGAGQTAPGWTGSLAGTLSIARLVLMVSGFYWASRDHGGYKTAFYMAGVAIVLSLLAGQLASLTFTLMSNILSAAMVYFICAATSDLLHTVENHRLARMGDQVWKVYLVSTGVRVVESLFSWELSVLLAALSQSVLYLVSMALITVELLGIMIFLVFLFRSCRALAR